VLKIISECHELVKLCHINCGGPVFVETHSTLCPSKFDTLLSNVITLSNIGRFSNFFSILIGTKFGTRLLLKFPTDPKHVSTLPCEKKIFT